MTEQQVLEGTWEEIALQAAELSGRRLRVSVLSEEENSQRDDSASESDKLEPLPVLEGFLPPGWKDAIYSQS